MKKLFAFIFLLSFITSNAQYSRKSYNDPAFQQFLKTETWVVLTGDEEFDTVLSRTLARFWKVTPYKLVSARVAHISAQNEALSFMLPLNLSYTNTYSSTSGGSYSSIAHEIHSYCVVLGGQTETEIIAYANYDFSGVQQQLVNAYGMHNPAPTKVDPEITSLIRTGYRLKDMIATMNHVVEIIRDNKVELKGNDVNFLNDNFYNKDAGILKTKTLYVMSPDVENPAKILKSYPYKIKIVSHPEYFQAIEEERKDIVYLLLTHGPAGITLYDPSEHKCVGNIPMRAVTLIDAGDFGSIAKLVNDADKK